MLNKLIWERSHRGTMEDKDAAIAHYEAHIEEVKKVVPDDKLLIFTVDQGWEPLCAFLEVDVPDTEFPNVNDRKDVKAKLADIKKGAYFVLTMLILAAIAGSALVYGLIRWLT